MVRKKLYKLLENFSLNDIRVDSGDVAARLLVLVQSYIINNKVSSYCVTNFGKANHSHNVFFH